MAVFVPGSAALLSTPVEISVSAKSLKSKDAFSKSDAVCILHLKDASDASLIEIGRTEEIKNDPNPTWIKKFEIEFKFEEKQILVFQVFDWDKKSESTKGQDLIGEVEVTLAEVMAFRGQALTKDLPKKAGSLCVVGEELSSSKDVVSIAFSAEKVDKMDTFGKSDPFLMLSRANKDGASFSPVFHTGYLKNTLNPEWQAISVPVRTLCHGDYKATFKIECFDWDSNQKHDLIGECFTSLDALKDGKPIPLINPKKSSKKGYQNSGLLKGQILSVTQERSFLDYLREGLELHFTIAVDFTASNGDPKEPQSLHYLGGGDNAYTRAIQAIGGIFQDYERDLMIPALGFGARVPPDTQVSHEFFLNGSPKDPYCKGVDGVLESYRKALQTVELFGPTNFAPCIRHVSKFAKAYADGKHYFILLILTDGVITDMPETLTALIDASALPVSVIIVGIGEEDFSAMKSLDADDKRISFEGRKAERDIVQFVELKKLQGEKDHVAKSVLAKHVLKEVPQQCVEFMKKIKK